MITKRTLLIRIKIMKNGDLENLTLTWHTKSKRGRGKYELVQTDGEAWTGEDSKEKQIN